MVLAASLNIWFLRKTKASSLQFGYELSIYPGYQIQMLLWEGDDEFPPSSQILFSDNFPVSFAAEDMAVMGDVIIGSLKAFLKAAKEQ